MEAPIAATFHDRMNLFISSTLLLPAFLVCALVPIVLLLKTASPKLKLRLPPAPPALPFIGHLHLLGTLPHQSLCKLSKTHGPLMLLRLGSIPVVVVSTPAMARQVLQTHDETFSSRPQLAVSKQLHNCENIAFSQPGPYWKRMRQICATDLFGPKRLDSFRPVIGEEVNALLRWILDNPTNVPIRAGLYAATSHIISRMVVGKRLTDMALLSQAGPSYNLVNLLVEAMRLIGLFNVGDYITWLAWLDLQGYVRKARAIAYKLHVVLQEIIDGRREMRCYRSDSVQEHDFLDVLMCASQHRRDAPLKDFNIRTILLDMYGAGIDTSSITTEWALYELLANPSKMRKLQEELEHITGMSRLVHEKDIPQLSYLHAVVKETMRLHPVLPLLLPHKANQECNISGYDIPVGALAYVNVWAIGRDPDVWESPLEFRPERFLGHDIDVSSHKFESIPFGSGRRVCPGMMLGLLNVRFMLASIVHCFDWSTTDEINMSEKFGIVIAPKKPLVATATLRLPKDLVQV